MKKRIPDICDIVEVRTKGNDSFWKEYNGEWRKWRVESYLKEAKQIKNPNWVEEILFDASQKCGPDKVRMQWCSKKHATHVSLGGVCGAIARIKDCVIVGRVEWTKELIKQHKESAKRLEGQVIF